MEEEIDLRGYVKVIAKRWKWIVGLTVVAVVVAAGASLLAPPTYEATAAISIPQPNPSISYTSLIGSTEVEAQVIEMLRASLSPAEQVPGGLIDRVKVSQENDGRLIRIMVQSDTSKKAAAIANVWANLCVKQIMEAEDAEEQRRKSLQEQQLQIVKQNLEAATQALIDFEEGNGFGVMGFGTLEEELQADRGVLRIYRAVGEDTDALLREAQALRESIQGMEAATLSESTAVAIDSLLQRAEQSLRTVGGALVVSGEGGRFEATGFASFQEELQTDRKTLRSYKATRDDIDDLLREAQALRESVQGVEAATFFESTAVAIESLLHRAEQGLRTVGGALIVSGEGGRFEAAGFASFQKELQADREALRSYKATRDDIDDLLREAQALRESVQQGESISSREIMSILMRQYLQAGSIEAGTTLGFELSEVFTSSVLTPNQQKEILGAVIVALEARQEAVLARISEQQERFAKQQMEILDAVIVALEARQEAVLARISEQQERFTKQQTEILDAVIVALKAKQETVSTAVEQLSAEVLQGERTLINKQSELNDLVRTRDIGQQIYDPLATQAEQEKLTIKVGVEVSEVEVISPAKEPGAPIQPNRMQVVLIAGTLGFLVGVFGAFVVEYFV